MNNIQNVNLKQGRLEQNYACLTILFALLLGGGTEQNLWSDHLIQLFIAPLLIIGFFRFPDVSLSNFTKLICLSLVLLIALQFMPFTSQIALPNSEANVNLLYWSASPSRSVEAGLYFLTCLGLFLYVSSVSMPVKIKILKVILIGVLIQSFVGIIQLSYSSRFELLGFLPFAITSGLFANQNHFSTMLFSIIPILGFVFLIVQKNKPLFLFLSALIIFLLFAIGSRVGMAFAVVQITLTLIWFFTDQLRTFVRGVIFTAMFVVGLFAMHFMDFSGVLADDLRSEIFENTWNAVKDNLWFGTGLGTFVLLYPSYESIDEISSYYINHAHNDYLELMLELGILAIIPFVLYLLHVLVLCFNRKNAGVLSITIFAVLAHSFLDYPLRTFSVAIIFVTASALLFHQEDKLK